MVWWSRGLLAMTLVMAGCAGHLTTESPGPEVAAPQPSDQLAYRFEATQDPATPYLGWGADGLVSFHRDGFGVEGGPRVTFVGGHAHPTGEARRETVSHYYVGEASQWRRDVQHYGAIRYADTWPGIDVVVYFTPDGRLEFDHHVSAHADVSRIKLGVEGAALVDGQLVAGSTTVHAPVAFEAATQTPVSAAFQANRDGTFGYQVGPYRGALVIDPILRFSTHQGGTGAEAQKAVAVGAHPTDPAKRRVYIVGEAPAASTAVAFGTATPIGTGHGNTVVTLSVYDYHTVTHITTAHALVHIGGTNADFGTGIALAPGGKIVVIGRTLSTNFPTWNPVRGDTSTVPQDYDGSRNHGASDVFIVRLTSTLTPDFGTLLGGAGNDYGRAVAVDANGRIAFAAMSASGTSSSDTFPAHNGYRMAPLSIYTEINVGIINPATTPATFETSTYLGGVYTDDATAVAVTSAGLYVLGQTANSTLIQGPPYPTTPGAYQQSNAVTQGNQYANALTRINRSTPTVLDFSTLVHGGSIDYSGDMVVMPDGTIWITGKTFSPNFPVCNNPTTPPGGNPCGTTPLQTSFAGDTDLFITRVKADGSGLLYSTFYGGSGNEGVAATEPAPLAIDPTRGHLVVAASPNSVNMPVNNALYPNLTGPGPFWYRDMFVLRFDAAAGPPAFFASYIGSSRYDYAHDVAVDDLGNVYVVGETDGPNFPSVNPTQPASGGGSDGIFLVIGKTPPSATIRGTWTTLTTTSTVPVPTAALPTLAVPPGQSIALDATLSVRGDFPLDPTTYTWTIRAADGTTILQTVTGGSTFPALSLPSPGVRIACVDVRDDGAITHPDGNDTACLRLEWENDPPVASDDAFTVSEDSGLSLLDVLGNDSEPDGQPMQIVSVSSIPASKGTLTHDGAKLHFTPAADFYTLPGPTGTLTATYVVGDGYGGQDTGTVTIEVQNVNDPPVAVDDTYTVTPGSTTTLNVLANDHDNLDPPGTLTVTVVGTPTAGSTILAGPKYVAPADFIGTATFTYTISDGALTATATVTVTVEPVDGVLARNDAFTVAEDTTASLDVLANDEGPARTPPAMLTSVGTPAHGTATIAGDGLSVLYAPTADFFGTDSFTYALTRGSTTSTATVTVTVDPVNDPPVAVDDTFTVSLGSTDNVLSVLANDGTGPDTEAAPVVVAVALAGDGTVSLVGGQVLYTPPDSVLDTTFTYTIEDPEGLQDTATVTVQVRPPPSAPVAYDDAYTVRTGEVAFLDVLANDVDDDALTVSWHDYDGSLGVMAIVAGGLQLTVPYDVVGTTTFQYLASDGGLESQPATVTLDVRAPLDPTLILELPDHICRDEPVTAHGIALHDGRMPASWAWSAGAAGATVPAVGLTQDWIFTPTDDVSLHVAVTMDDASIIEGSLPIATVSCAPPTADFTFSVQGRQASFVDASHGNAAPIATWSWTIGASTYTGQEITHGFPGGGTYAVTLTVTDQDGRVTSITKHVSVDIPPTVGVASEPPAPEPAPPKPADRPPVALASAPSEVVIGRTFQLDASQSHDPDGDAVRVRWVQTQGPPVDFDAAVAQPGIVALMLGEYHFRVDVTANGLKDSAHVVVTVVKGAPVEAAFTVDVVAKVVLTDTSNAPLTALRQWRVDGVAYSGPVLRLDLAPGEHVVELIVENEGQRSVATQTVHVDAPAVPSVPATTGSPASVQDVDSRPGPPAWLIVVLAAVVAVAMTLVVLWPRRG